MAQLQSAHGYVLVGYYYDNDRSDVTTGEALASAKVENYYDHHQEWLALMDAERLAKENPGARFYVYKTTSGFHVPDNLQRINY